MKEIMWGDEKITVFKASGYYDGYYWDMNAKILYNGDLYQLYDAGSGSGYIPCCSAITKYEFDRLYGEEQGQIDEDDDWDYMESEIFTLLNNFIESGAKNSWEYQEDDHWNPHILVDGEEVNNGEEEEAQS